MKSIRLNDTIRCQIINNAIKDTRPDLDYDNCDANHKKFAADYGPLFYAFLYDKNMQRRLKNAPKGMVPQADHIRVKLVYQSDHEDPRYTDGRKSMTSDHVEIPLPKRMPIMYQHSCQSVEIKAKKIGVDGVKLVDEYASTQGWKLRSKRRRYEDQLMQFLKQFTTTKKLAEEWPEGKDYIPKEEKKKTTALVVKCDTVNTLLGLPK